MLVTPRTPHWRRPVGKTTRGRLASAAVRAPGPNDRLSVWNLPRSQHPLPYTPKASGTPAARAHPSNERRLHRYTRRHSGGSVRPGSFRGHGPARAASPPFAVVLVPVIVSALFTPRPPPWHAAAPSNPR